MKPGSFFIQFLMLAGFFAAQSALFAHGDEIHGAAAAAPAAGTHFTVYGISDRYELTLYYPEITDGKEAHLTLYVAEKATNRAVEKAEMTITSADDPSMVFEADAIGPGIYALHGTFPKNNTNALQVQINHNLFGADLIGIQGIEVGKKLHDDHTNEQGNTMPAPWVWFLAGLLPGILGMWWLSRRRSRMLTAAMLLLSAWFSAPAFNPAFAHGDEDHGPKTSGNTFDASVFVPKETQFMFEVLTQPLTTSDYQSAATVFGNVVAAADGLGVVMAPQNGRITSVKVRVGDKVQAGQVLAYLVQNLSTSDQVAVTSSNTGLQVQVETARARTTAARREVDRLKKIADIAAAREIQAAEAEYAQAQAELQVLENMALSDNKTANSRSLVLKAPITGVLGSFNVVPGMEVFGGQQLFSVTNLSKVYVEAQAYPQDLPFFQAGGNFTAFSSDGSGKQARLKLLTAGQDMNAGAQSVRVFFEMENVGQVFKIGELVTVKAQNVTGSRQLAVPNSAITEINGKTAVFIKQGPEMYALRYIQTQSNNGIVTPIVQGLNEGQTVVTNSVYEVKMIYLNQ
ncbi:MAG: efflux RND transporter periplasmic adaptor subunit [Saprospiraceae bacterium]|nr:efflux RND transporter periplasmic adaptor subunit [Saprospiraceae bacterium]